MILSFAWTTEAVVSGVKSVTRRVWSDRYFRQWVAAYRRGDVFHDAFTRSPRYGGKGFGFVNLVKEPYRERLRDMPVEDLAAEGGYWKDKDEFIDLFGGDGGLVVAVVRFRFVSFEEWGYGTLRENPRYTRRIR